MTALIGLPEYRPVLERFVALAQQALGNRLMSVVLYGSLARGQARWDSDTDLLIILRDASLVYRERLEPLLAILRQLQDDIEWKRLEAQGLRPYMSLLVLSKEEAEETHYIYLDMVDEAKLLVDVDGFFRKRLETLRRRLQELGAKRVEREGGWYWDLKPDLKCGEALIL